jgi:uncharacterized membrane protein (GlpM family)
MELSLKQSQCRLVKLDHDKTHDRDPTAFRRIILRAVNRLIAYHLSLIAYHLSINNFSYRDSCLSRYPGAA